MWLLRLFVILVLISLLGSVVEALFITFPPLLPIIVIVFVFRYFKHNRDNFDAVVDWVNKIAFNKSDRTMCSICRETMYASDGLMLVDGIICKKTVAEMSPLLQNHFSMRVSDVQEHLEHRRKYGGYFTTDLVLYRVNEDKNARGFPTGRVEYSTKDRMFRFKIEHPETKAEQYEVVDIMDVENFMIEVVKEQHDFLTPTTYDVRKAKRKLRNEREGHEELSYDEVEFYRWVLGYELYLDGTVAHSRDISDVKISKESFYFYLVVSLKDPFRSDVYVRLNKQHIYEGEHRSRHYKYVETSAELLKELNDLKESEIVKVN